MAYWGKHMKSNSFRTLKNHQKVYTHSCIDKPFLYALGVVISCYQSLRMCSAIWTDEVKIMS